MDVCTRTFRLKNELQVLWRTHRWHLLMLFVCVVLGAVLACIIIANPLMTHTKISPSLIDANITNATFPRATIGNFLMGRFLDVGLGLLFLFIACLHSWTALLCFPLLIFRGFSLVINLYLIVARFGALPGAPLLVFYSIFLITVTVVFMCAVLFVMQQCSEIRRNGMRVFNWRSFFRTLIVYAVIIAVIAFLEWLVYAVFLSKMVFLAVT